MTFATWLLHCGFAVDMKIDCSRDDMNKAIRTFGDRIEKDGVGLFYYAGHGVQVKGENYLVPVGANVKREYEVDGECIKLSRVLGAMEYAGNRLNIVVLDACRDNPFARSFRSHAKGLSRMDAPAGSFLAYATAPGSLAEDGRGRNGIYTASLLQHLKTPGLQIEEVFKRVRVDVVNATDKAQILWESSSLMGRFYFVASGSVVASMPTETGTGRGALKVTSRPEGAGVYVDGTYRGAAPLTIGGIIPGTVQVAVKKPGYTSGSRIVNVSAGNTALVDFYLDHRAGRLYVQTEPAGARGRILNINPGYHDGIELDPGRYHLEVSMIGHTTETRWVEVAEGQDRNELFQLERRQTATGRGFTNSLGQEFVWIAQGSFMMGSPSGEPEREDDETPHRVTLRRGYYLQTTEVTQGQWKEIMG